MSEIPPQPLPPRRPTTGERTRTVCLVLIAICTVGATLYFLRGILTPLLIALFLFFLIRPAAELLARWRLPAWFTYTVLLLVLGVAVYATSRVVERNAEAFQQRLPYYRTRLQNLADEVSRLIARVDPEGHIELDQLGRLFDFTYQEMAHLAFGTALEFIETAVMVLFYLVFLFLEAQLIPRRVREAYSPEQAEKILRISNNIRDGINNYLSVKTSVSLGLGLTTGILGALFGLDFWPLWAVLMFLSNYVTYFGSVVALVPPIALAYLQFSGLVPATAFAALLVLSRFAWIDYVEIRFSGRHLNISPLLLLVSIMLLGWMWGVVGMILAVPLVTVIKIILLNFETTRHWGRMISEK
jgi:predicted PurR-regulated permease PerM